VCGVRAVLLKRLDDDQRTLTCTVLRLLECFKKPGLCFPFPAIKKMVEEVGVGLLIGVAGDIGNSPELFQEPDFEGV